MFFELVIVLGQWSKLETLLDLCIAQFLALILQEPVMGDVERAERSVMFDDVKEFRPAYCARVKSSFTQIDFSDVRRFL